MHSADGALVLPVRAGPHGLAPSIHKVEDSSKPQPEGVIMCTKLTSLLAAFVTGVLAVGAITLVLTEPATALDRLLQLGRIELTTWLEKTCNDVDKMTEPAELDKRRQRILTLRVQSSDRLIAVLKQNQQALKDAEGKPTSEMQAAVDKAQQDAKSARRADGAGSKAKAATARQSEDVTPFPSPTVGLA